mgnify:CR=1 FL=1
MGTENGKDQDKVMIKKVKKLLDQKKKPVEIAKILNCSIVSVMYWIQICKEENAE